MGGFCKATETLTRLPTHPLYLHTQNKQDYYAKRGWTVLERFRAWDNDQWLMVRDL